MLASWKYASATPTQAEVDDSAIRTAIWGSTVAAGGNVMRKANGYDSIAGAHVDRNDQWYLTYELKSDELAAGLKAGKLEIKVEGPHSLGAFGFSFSPPMAGLAAATRIAFKSCI